jgi:2-isopropylmalate synthase
VAYEAVRNAPQKRIHTFISTSDHHILGKFGHARYGRDLKEKRKTILKMAHDSVAYALTLCDDVEFSAEDAGRTDIGYLSEVVAIAIEAGAGTINIPDTTGYTMPEEFSGIIRELCKRVPNIDRIVLSVHCHNDLGCAVANSLAAVSAGARQVECTINGIGERAGNASLEEIVMALKVRKDLMKFDTGIETRELYNTSRMVSGFTGIIVQPNKAIVGENAFAHESGIHQDGMLKNRNTYEIMTPETVGVPRTKIVLGRHSGRHGLKSRLEELGYHLPEEELDRLYERFTEVADKKKEVFDDDLRLLMGDEIFRENTHFRLEDIQVYSGSHMIPTATVKMRRKNRVIQESATGDGPVDALFNSIDRAVRRKFRIESYQVRSVTAGREAMGEAVIRIRNSGRTFVGRGVSTDIIEASAKAYLQAINTLEEERQLQHKQKKIRSEV